MESKKKSIVGLEPTELEKLIVDIGLKKFVAKQVLDWIYKKNNLDISNFKNISKKDQSLLFQNFEFQVLKTEKILSAHNDSAVKFIFECKDQQKIEAVVLKERNYNTLCLSSQCGCPVDCKFCLTGVVGFKRQLSKAEIISQLISVQSYGYKISNIVFMGMGEPLLNYSEVIPAIDCITAEWGPFISKRKITVSTSGYLPGINRLIKDKRSLNIAFSVGSLLTKIRKNIMPIEKRYPILDVVKQLWLYQKDHNRMLTLEYTLLKNQNHSKLEIDLLINCAKYLSAKINLINFNPHPRLPFSPVSKNKIEEISQYIKLSKVAITIRHTKGQDIVAACGQLGESILNKT